MAIIRLDCNLNGGDSVTPNNELFYRIYGDADNYASPIWTTGTALTDGNVTVDNDRVMITGVDGASNGSFKISAVDLAGNEGVLSDAKSGYILDAITGSVGAWSLRQLSSSTTSVIRGKRDSDNAELDFTADEIVNGTLATWSQSGDVTVVIIYDQSGNANNMVKTNQASPPRIVISGVVQSTNGKPAINNTTDGAVRQLKAGQTLASGLFSIHMVADSLAVGTDRGEQLLANHSGAANEGRTVYAQVQDDISLKNVTFFNNGASQVGAMTTDWVNGQFTISNYGDDSDYVLQRNGGTPETVITGQALVQETVGMSLGNNGADSPSSINQWLGKYQEVIVFDSDKSSNKSQIEADINDYYSIY